MRLVLNIIETDRNGDEGVEEREVIGVFPSRLKERAFNRSATEPIGAISNNCPAPPFLKRPAAAVLTLNDFVMCAQFATLPPWRQTNHP